MMLKLQPQLTNKNINPTQYQKMRVNLAANVFNSSTTSTLLHIKDKFVDPQVIESTVTFFNAIDRWFSMICSKRDDSLNENSQNFNSNFKFLKNFIVLIKNLSFSIDNKWKPIQTGFILSTESILNLFEYLANKYSEKELILRRLTTDSVENLFSQLRSAGQTHPNSVYVKNSLKRICFAKNLDISKSSNYSQDESSFFTSLSSLRKYEENMLYKSTIVCDDINVNEIDFDNELDFDERNVLYYIGGWIQNSLFRSLKCEKCLNYLNRGNPLQVVSIDSNLAHQKDKFHAIPSFISILDICEKTFQHIINQYENFAKLDCDKK
jgi:hypothetical protein